MITYKVNFLLRNGKQVEVGADYRKGVLKSWKILKGTAEKDFLRNVLTLVSPAKKIKKLRIPGLKSLKFKPVK